MVRIFNQPFIKFNPMCLDGKEARVVIEQAASAVDRVERS
jgi:hypothetical protein